MSLKIVAISDTHNKHRQIESVPDGDVLVHAGDITKQGEIAVIDDFAAWMQELPHRHKILISGNHDFPFDRDNNQKKEILKMLEERGLIYLENSGVEIDGVYFYGSPNTPIWHSRWAFNFPRDSKELKQKWDAIPTQTNVLITHGPPHEILDEAPRGIFGYDFENTGCRLLSKRIQRLRSLKAHIFGHIHPAYGKKEVDGIFYVNAAICDDRHNPHHLPHVFEI